LIVVIGQQSSHKATSCTSRTHITQPISEHQTQYLNTTRTRIINNPTQSNRLLISRYSCTATTERSRRRQPPHGHGSLTACELLLELVPPHPFTTAIPNKQTSPFQSTTSITTQITRLKHLLLYYKICYHGRIATQARHRRRRCLWKDLLAHVRPTPDTSYPHTDYQRIVTNTSFSYSVFSKGTFPEVSIPPLPSPAKPSPYLASNPPHNHTLSSTVTPNPC
jgi:hypothetical protein